MELHEFDKDRIRNTFIWYTHIIKTQVKYTVIGVFLLRDHEDNINRVPYLQLPLK